MNFKEIEFEQKDHAVIIRFNRPESRNCIGPIGHRELIAAWQMFRDDPNLYVAIITGQGDKAFCSGADLQAVEALAPREEDISLHNRGEAPGILGPTRWTNIYKPIIAAINGVALAGGLEWACFADIRIAEEHAQFGVTSRRWNIGLADGGTQRLPHIVGLGRALDLIITGRVIDAGEAEQMGLVNYVVPRQQSLPRALELAEFISSLPQDAIRTDKEAVMRGLGQPLDEALKIEAACFNRLSPRSMIEGAARFNEKRHADQGSGEGLRTPGLSTQKNAKSIYS